MYDMSRLAFEADSTRLITSQRYLKFSDSTQFTKWGKRVNHSL